MEPLVKQRSTLPFQGEKPNFQEQWQNFEIATSKFNINHHSTSTISKGLGENFFKMSWDNPVSPIDAKNSIVFFCELFLGYPGLLGDIVFHIGGSYMLHTIASIPFLLLCCYP